MGNPETGEDRGLGRGAEGFVKIVMSSVPRLSPWLVGAVKFLPEAGSRAKFWVVT